MKYTTGFRLVSELDGSGLLHYPAAAVSITKGQALFNDTNGYATNANTAFDENFLGVAAETVDNSGGSAGDLDVAIIPPLPQYKFWVPNGSATKAAAADRGEMVDLEANSTIDVTDTTIDTWGFMIDEIDISTEALAATTIGTGFVKGSFQIEGDQA